MSVHCSLHRDLAGARISACEETDGPSGCSFESLMPLFKASGYAVVNLAAELASINDYFEQLPRYAICDAPSK